MLYIGYPIRAETAFMLFNVKTVKEAEVFAEEHGMGLFELDKGVYVLGLEIDYLAPSMGLIETGVRARGSVDMFIIHLLEHKQDVMEFMERIGAREFEVQFIEGELIRVLNQQPYVLHF